MAAKDDSDRMRSLRDIVRSKFTGEVFKTAGGIFPNISSCFLTFFT